MRTVEAYPDKITDSTSVRCNRALQRIVSSCSRCHVMNLGVYTKVNIKHLFLKMHIALLLLFDLCSQTLIRHRSVASERDLRKPWPSFKSESAATSGQRWRCCCLKDREIYLQCCLFKQCEILLSTHLFYRFGCFIVYDVLFCFLVRMLS